MIRRVFLASALSLACLAPGAQAARNTSTLVVESVPRGSVITLDGYRSGKTPHTFRGLAAGSHEISLVRAGYLEWTKTVTLKPAKTHTVHARLAHSTPLPGPEKARRLEAAQTHTRSVQAWLKSSLAFGSVTTTGGGIFAAQPTSRPIYDSESGLYITTDLDDAGNLLATFYLDEALTQPAGTMTVTFDFTEVGVDYSFTDGELAGNTGHLQVAFTDLDALVATGNGALPDGSTWSADFMGTLTDDGLAIDGAADVTAPGGETSHWEIHAAQHGQDTHVTTSDGYTLDLHTNDDGSGSGTLRLTDTGELLATISWTADGVATISYPDGTSDTVHLFG